MSEVNITPEGEEVKGLDGLRPAENKGPSRNEVLRHTAKALRQLGRVFHAEDLEAAFPEVFSAEWKPANPGPWVVRGQVEGEFGYSESRHIYSSEDRENGGTGCIAKVPSSLANAELIVAAVNAFTAKKAVSA